MRIKKIKICNSCNEISKIHAKSMCHKCYSKAYRKTESGKKALDKYNNTKGVEAQKRYRLKHHKPRKPKKK